MKEYLSKLWQPFAAQRERWVLWLPVPLGCGIAVYFSLMAEPSGAVLWLLALMAGGGCLAFKGRPAFPAVLAVFLFVLGMATAQWRTQSVAAPVLEKETYPATIETRVVEVEALPRTRRIVTEGIKVVGGKIWQENLPERIRIRLMYGDDTPLQAGDMIRIKSVLLPISSPVMPGAFDFQRHAWFMRLGATGYAIGRADVVVPAPQEGFFFEHLRDTIRTRVQRHLTDPDRAALMTAFLIGEDNGIPEKVWEICRKSGIAHLIAISGSHFVLVAGFAFFILRALLAAFPVVALRWPVKKICAGFAIAVSVFYMLLIGAPIPAQRAALSISVIMLAIILDRDPFTLRLAAFAAFVILLLQPESLIGASFQLSFAAVISLIAVYEATGEWWQRKFRDESVLRRIGYYLLACFTTSWVAAAGTAVFALYHFSSVPLFAGLVANMFAVPVSSFITFPAALIACLLMPLGMEKGALLLADASLAMIMKVAENVAAWPHALYHVQGWPFWMLGVAAIGGLWLCLWRGRLRWFGLAPLLFVAVLIPQVPRADVLVSDGGKLFAVRSSDGGLIFSSQRREKFVRNAWQELEGTPASFKWPEGAGETADGTLTCDDVACFYTLGRTKIAFLHYRKKGEPQLPCPVADIVVTGGSMRRSDCEGSPLILHKWRLLENGVHVFYDDHRGGMPRMVSTRMARGDRPWVRYLPPYAERMKNRAEKKTTPEALKATDAGLFGAETGNQ